MKSFGLVLACCALLGACTVVDVGVGRGAGDWSWDLGADAYMKIGWPTNEHLLSVDLVGGSNGGTLVAADLWRLLHLEVGLLGVGLGLGPLQLGAGFGFYAPHAPATLAGNNPFE